MAADDEEWPFLVGAVVVDDVPFVVKRFVLLLKRPNVVELQMNNPRTKSFN